MHADKAVVCMCGWGENDFQVISCVVRFLLSVSLVIFTSSLVVLIRWFCV